MNKISFNVKSVFCYIILLGLLAVALLTEKPLQSEVVFDENIKPGMDRLFVPVRTSVADSLFSVLTGGEKKTARVKDGKFVVSHPDLGNVLIRTKMGDGLWKELGETDPALYRSSDGNELHMSMGVDEISGDEFVWVPAGIMSLFVK